MREFVHMILAGDHVNTWQENLRAWLASNVLALVALRLETYASLDGSRTPRKQTRLVLENHGPAAAVAVGVSQLRSGDGTDVSWTLREPRFPIPSLAPGQRFHVRLITNWNGPNPEAAEVRWTDIEEHTEDRWLSIEET